MKKDTPQKSKSFFENNSWYHRTKILQEDGTVKYGKKGGFATSKEADKSYDRYEAEFKKAYRDYQIANRINTEIMLKDYLVYWFEEIFSERIESTSRMVSAYVLYNIIMPQLDYDIKVRYVNSAYLDTVLEKAAKVTASAGNKARELLLSLIHI